MTNNTPYFNDYITLLETIGKFKLGTSWIARTIPFIKEVPFEITKIDRFSGMVTYNYFGKGPRIRHVSELNVALKNGVIRPYKD